MHEPREPKTTLQHQFCRRLKAEREQKGISLHAIAEQSKVAVTHFKNLERADLSRWPSGIYRRQFFREYMKAIGLPPSTLDEFQELFPEPQDDAPAPVAPSKTAPPVATRVSEGLRLALAAEWRVPPCFSPTRAKAAGIDAFIVVLVSATASLVLQVGLGPALGTVALLYFSASTVLFGRSIALRQFGAAAPDTSARDAVAPGADAESLPGERRSGSDRRHGDRRRPAEVGVLWHRLLSPQFRVRLGQRGKSSRPAGGSEAPHTAPWGKPGYARPQRDTH